MASFSREFRATLVAGAVLFLLGGCEIVWPQDPTEPVGIGRKTDDFRRSPCACKEVPSMPADDEYRRRLVERLG